MSKDNKKEEKTKNNSKNNSKKEEKVNQTKKNKSKKEIKAEKKALRDYNSLKRKAKIIGIICLVIIAIELVVMYAMHLIRESKITYVDTLYSIQNVDDEYYLAAGSSNFRHSKYNSPFTYEYEDSVQEGKINTVYAEQAKLVKLDQELNVIFEVTFKTDYDSIFYDAAKVDDGYIAVGSYVYEEKQLSINTRDGLIVKYDFDGNVLWSKNYQVLGDTEFKKILVLEDGFLVVGQSIYENLEIGNHDNGGGIIVKYDFDGNILWKNNFGGNKSGIFNDVVALDDGYIAVGKDALNYGMIVKFDNDGNRLFVKNYEYTDPIGMSDVELKDDKLYIASSYNTSEETDEEGNIIYQYDACIFVYDLNWELLDIYSLGGDLEDRFNSLLLLDDKIVALGYTKSSDIELNDLNYNEDMSEGMIVTFDYEGNVLENTVYSGSKNESLNDIIVSIPNTADKINNTKTFVAVGYSNSRRGLFNGNNKDYYAKVLRYDEKFTLLDEK